MRQLLDGLMAASLRAGVEPPPLDLGAFGLLDPAAFSPILQDIAHRLIMPCMEHLSRITWDRLAIEYEGRHREMSSQGLILAQADAGFSDARQRLRALNLIAKRVLYYFEGTKSVLTTRHFNSNIGFECPTSFTEMTFTCSRSRV